MNINVMSDFNTVSKEGICEIVEKRIFVRYYTLRKEHLMEKKIFQPVNKILVPTFFVCYLVLYIYITLQHNRNPVVSGSFFCNF